MKTLFLVLTFCFAFPALAADPALEAELEQDGSQACRILREDVIAHLPAFCRASSVEPRQYNDLVGTLDALDVCGYVKLSERLETAVREKTENGDGPACRRIALELADLIEP